MTAGELKKLEFPNGGSTTLAELRQAAARAGKIAVANVVATAGRPPTTVLPSPPGPDEASKTLSESGIQHGDMLFLRRAVDATSDGAPDPAKAKGKGKGKGKAKIPRGRTLGSTPTDPAILAAAAGGGAAPPQAVEGSSQKKRAAPAGISVLGGKAKRSRHKWGSGRTLGDDATNTAVGMDTDDVAGPAAAPAVPTSWEAEGDSVVFGATDPQGFAQLDAELSGELSDWDLAFRGVVSHALLQLVKSGEDLSAVDEAELGGSEAAAEFARNYGSQWDLHYEIIMELMYAFREAPERATGEYDLEWIREVLRKNDFILEDDADDALIEAYDEAADLYAEAELSVLATELYHNPEKQEMFDMEWIRTTLGYTTPDNDEYAMQVWRKTWEDAKLASQQQLKAAEEESAGLAPASASAEIDGDAPNPATLVKSKARAKLGFDFSAVVQDSLLDVGENGDAIGAVEQSLGAGLVEAVGARGDNAAKQAFQTALKSHEAAMEAERKVAAALAGQVSFAVKTVRTLAGQEDEYIEVKYKVERKWHEETVKLIPILLVAGILYDVVERSVEDELDK